MTYVKLSRREEEVMEVIWNGKKVFAKNIIDSYQDPKPADTTISTLLKRMYNKGFINYKQKGNSREYFALVKKEDYFSNEIKKMIAQSFNNSVSEFIQFFTKTSQLSITELEKIKKIIENEIIQKNK